MLSYKDWIRFTLQGTPMHRREFFTILGGAGFAWSLPARAQQPERMRHIGALMSTGESDPEEQARLTAFAQRLKELGWIAGSNMRLDIRWGSSDDG